MIDDEKTIFERGRDGRSNYAQRSGSPTQNWDADVFADWPDDAKRRAGPRLPEVSELQAIRHYTRLSAKNFSIDSHFYPLGSCTMKYNPRGAQRAALLPGFANHHPLAPDDASQGVLAAMHELQGILETVSGMDRVSLAPMAGAQGELAGVAIIRAYHESRGDQMRTEIIVPSAAHGTNPASAAMCGYDVVEVAVTDEGDIDFDALLEVLSPRTAGLMMTNPSTLGVFERRIREVADAVHDAGGQLYYDGANLNAVLGRVRPRDMGFDVMHMNLHKTFATPHGGGGPGAGPVGVAEHLEAFLPIPYVEELDDGRLRWVRSTEHSIGRMSAFSGNVGILLRALAYARLLGGEGLRRVGSFAALNANYLATRLREAGFDLAYPTRRASHEFIISFRDLARRRGVTAMDVAKRLLDYGIHAPTTYFPLLVPECFLIEPTETESKETLDAFVDALVAIQGEAEVDPEKLHQAPHTLPVSRLDEVKAARELDIRYAFAAD